MGRFLEFLNEQALYRNAYEVKASGIADKLFDHCSYLILYSDGRDDEHWKNEIYGFLKPLKVQKIKGGSKRPLLLETLVEGPYGSHFEDVIERPSCFLSGVYYSEEKEHPFSFDMKKKQNILVYIEALDRFYYEFLIEWTGNTEENPDKRVLFNAIDRYLISARGKMK